MAPVLSRYTGVKEKELLHLTFLNCKCVLLWTVLGVLFVDCPGPSVSSASSHAAPAIGVLTLTGSARSVAVPAVVESADDLPAAARERGVNLNTSPLLVEPSSSAVLQVAEETPAPSAKALGENKAARQ